MPSAIVLSDKKIKLTNCKHPLLMNSKKLKKKNKIQPPLASLAGETANNVGHVH